MKRREHVRMLAMWLFAILLHMLSLPVSAQGRVVFEGAFASRTLGTNRFVRIYLPPSYETLPRKRYPVLYLHDGQNVFSTVGEDVAFGWGNWQLDKTVTQLSI